MRKDGIAFWNASGFEESPGTQGWILPRYPKAVRDAMTPRGRFVSMESTGVELRFVTEAETFRLFLGNLQTDPGIPVLEYATSQVQLYRGDVWVGQGKLEAGKVTALHLQPPPRFAQADRNRLRGRFSPEVVRVVFDRSVGAYCGCDFFGKEARPPRMDELPGLTMLSYGSSITHSNVNGYPAIAARSLGVDVLNKGLSGACALEKEVATHLASLEDWDFATLELGVNVRDWMEPGEFDARSRFLVGEIRKAHPGKPLFLLTIFPNAEDFLVKRTPLSETQDAMREILRRIVWDSKDADLHLVEGSEVLRDLFALSGDLIHPSGDGHSQMGTNLARLLRPILKAKFGERLPS